MPYINVYQTPNGWQYTSGVQFPDRETAREQHSRLAALNLRPVFTVKVTQKVYTVRRDDCTWTIFKDGRKTRIRYNSKDNADERCAKLNEVVRDPRYAEYHRSLESA